MKKKKTEIQRNTYEGITVDVSDISDELTDRARRFVFWFSFPGTDAFQNKKRAAIAAGYAPKNASVSGYKLYKNPKVVKEIQRVSKNYNSETIGMLYQKYINTLETRAFFDPADFVSGNNFKPIESIALEKRICLDQPVFDVKEGKIVGYTFGSRRAAMAEIKEICSVERPFFVDENDEDLEIIMSRIELRQKRRNTPEYAALAASIVEYGGSQEEL